MTLYLSQLLIVQTDDKKNMPCSVSEYHFEYFTLHINFSCCITTTVVWTKVVTFQLFCMR